MIVEQITHPLRVSDMTANEFLKAYPIELSSFADGKHVVDGKTPFKWTVYLTFRAQTYNTKFTKGAGHATLRGRKDPLPHHKLQYYVTRIKNHETFFNQVIPIPPFLKELLYCLQSDCSTYDNAPIWEDFASEMGMDADSITQRRIFKKCRKQYYGIKKLLGDSVFRIFLNTNFDEE